MILFVFSLVVFVECIKPLIHEAVLAAILHTEQ